MKAKRVLVAHPYLHPSGGGNVVAAWALQALRDEFDVTLATLGPVDCAALNRNFGTSLTDRDFTIRIAPAGYRLALRALPTRGALMQMSALMRWARALDSRALDGRGHFDVLFGTQNETDFGRPGIQYVHYPWVYLPRPDAEMLWYHHIPGFLPLYRGLCQTLSGSSNDGLRRNLSLANSEFVVGKIREIHGLESEGVVAEIVYPPVPGSFPETPWAQRRAAVVAVGRMHEIKRWEMAVEVLDLVRQQGLELGLTLIAAPEQPAYGKRMASLAASRPWFRILSDISRDELAREVASHRYGIHTMENEHFGIAPAELLQAGCIPFVHDSGGPVEIVGGRRELRFSDARDAAAKLATVVQSPALESELRHVLALRRDAYSAEKFTESIRRIVREYR